MKFTSVTDEAYIAMSGFADYAYDFISPTLRLGVTGLSRAGKTVFITSFVHSLINGGKLPLFEPYASGRIKRAYLQPQPDDEVPRFPYEKNIAALLDGDSRRWPQSTSQISQLRLTLEFEPEGLLARTFSNSRLNVDIIDYPGEWLLDLPLLDLTYAEWSQQTLEAARETARREISAEWIAYTEKVDPTAQEDEQLVQEAAELFTSYLKNAREDRFALSTLPPGRFLMPGDLAGSPLVTFAPLDRLEKAEPGTMYAIMERRYNAYVKKVVKPFFLNHFARLDRQIVLVDMLSALNAGPDAVLDLREALADILRCFRPGRTNILNAILGKKIDKVLFAATKADHLHHTSHKPLENILRFLIEEAKNRTGSAGATYDVQAVSAVRATRESMISNGGEQLPAIVGTPEKGQELSGETYDGLKEIALFPGDLPENPKLAFDKNMLDSTAAETGFLRFRPPDLATDESDLAATTFPHIRLDKSLNFLLGDKIR